MVKYIILLVSALLIGSVLSAQNHIIPFGAPWKYFDQGQQQDTTWQQPGFEDATWKTGPAILGYGNLNESTLVGYGPDANRKYTTTYFRKTFAIGDAARYSSYTAHIKRDDGVVVYVNGTEVYRSNLPAGPIAYATLASVAKDDGRTPQPFRIDAPAFHSGDNVIAVEMHQAGLTNPDLAFDLELVGNTGPPTDPDRTPPAVLHINRQSPSGATTDAAAVTWRIAFSEQVTGVEAADFTVTTVSGDVRGVLGNEAVVAADSGATRYDVTVSAITGAGTLRLDLNDAATNIADTAGNLLVGGYTTGQTYAFGTVTGEPTHGLLIPLYATWEYLDNGSSPDTSWRTQTGANAPWKTGPAILGYGNLNEATIVSYGGNPNRKHITTYFRKTIHLADVSQFSSFTGKLKMDDGAVVYVNGKEVYRSNLPPGPITAATLASQSKDDGRILRSFGITAAAFQTGDNVVAVEIHQTTLTNADLAFDLELFGHPAFLPADQDPPAVLGILRQFPAAQATNAASATFRVTFSEPVTGVDAHDFLLTPGGTASGQIQELSPYGTHGMSYDIKVGAVAGEGSLRLDLKASGTGITDGAGNEAHGGFSGGQSFTIQQTAPRILLTRGPYLQMGSTTAVTLRWRTDQASDSRIEVGTTYGSYDQVAANPVVTTEHEIRISGLSPGTRYYYRFGSTTQVLQGDTDNYFVTAPQANNPNKVRIAALGDCGMNKNEFQSNTLNAYRTFVGEHPADLLLLLGDNAYDDGTDAEYQTGFFDAFSSTLLKNHMLFPAPGNHEYHLTSPAARTADYYKIFSLPAQGESGGVASGTEAFYAFDWGDIHFISLDSYGTEKPNDTRLYDTLGTQVTWLKKDLAANTKPWVIVYWHHPPFSMGNHNSDTEEELILIRERLLRILERNGVDLVLTGHSHDYERSYLLKNYYGKEASFDASQHAVTTSSGRYDGSANSCPFVTSSARTSHGTMYVVSGSAGQGGDLQASWPHDAMPYSDSEGGMVYLEVEQNRLDVKYLRTDGMVWDRFTILQDVNKTTAVTADSGGTAQLTASWVGTYRWSTGETTRTITVSPASDTTFQVTDDQNCLRDVFSIKARHTSLALKRVATRPAREKESENHAPWLYPALVSRGASLRVEVPIQKRLQAKVIDITGRQLYETEFTGTVNVETGRLSPGLYLVRLQGTFYRKTLKFIVKE